MNISILNVQDARIKIKDVWNKLVQDDHTNLLGLDTTSTFEWFESITTSFPEAGNAKILVISNDQKGTLGLLPIIIGKSNLFGTHLLLPTELYGGRNGPLIANDDPSVFCNMLENLYKLYPNWCSLDLTLVTGSNTERMVIDACKQKNYKIIRGIPKTSPYFPLLENQDAFLNNTSKSVRQMLRTSRNKFQAEGSLELREYSDSRGAYELFDAVIAIDLKSWKHKAGTAITNKPRQESFYRDLFPRAMSNDLLHAQLLLSNGNPVAYNFGLRRCGVYSCLKQSHDEAFDKFSPSYLVNLALIENLRKHNVLTYDFMGKAEPHKLRWSSSTSYYERCGYRIFNNTANGWLIFNTQKLKTFISDGRQKIEPAKSTDQTEE